jgi:hypothetical protein
VTALLLDRMALDEVGLNPLKLAGAIHRQLGERPGAVPVHDIARALDIIDIREEPLSSFEGALITGAERDEGMILVNATASRQRRRYTIAHELLHFLNAAHRPTSPDGFRCSSGDMRLTGLGDRDRHRRQEAEANTFAIELMAPTDKVKHLLRDAPDVRQVLTMARELDLSREASARRLVELHPETIAAVFSRQGRVQYAVTSPDFPSLAHAKGDLLPLPPSSGVGLPRMNEADPDEWLRSAGGIELREQTLAQQNGFATTLLWVSEEPDPDELKDTFDRFDRSGDR